MNIIRVRKLKENDSEIINAAFETQGWSRRDGLYAGYYREQEAGIREVLVAEKNDEMAGYLTILWESEYPPFRKKGIPEISDFNVFEKFQREGIGSVLMQEAEERIFTRSALAGIRVGVTEDYGPAHILYVNRGYVPDGKGLVKGSEPLEYGKTVVVDDDLVLCMLKKI